MKITLTRFPFFPNTKVVRHLTDELIRDVAGIPILNRWGELQYRTAEEPFLEVETVQWDKTVEPVVELLTDLQAGSMNCYIAEQWTYTWGVYVFLFGNGWADECRYPFHLQKYPLIGGKTAKTLIKKLRANQIPDFEHVYSGNKSDLVIVE